MITATPIQLLALAQDAIVLEPLPGRQRLVAILLAVALLAVVVELLRRRKLREEYSLIWVVTALLLVVLAVWQELIVLFSAWIGAATATSTLFFGCLLFLLLAALQFSVRMSKLTHRQKALVQRIALLEAELKHLRTRPAQAGDELAGPRKVAPREASRTGQEGAA